MLDRIVADYQRWEHVMTEANHPLEDEARALVDDSRFCEWLDACHGWRWRTVPSGSTGTDTTD